MREKKLLNLKINSKYILIFNVGGKDLTYSGKIISCSDGFISFEDKFRKRWTYNIKNLISSAEKEWTYEKEEDKNAD